MLELIAPQARLAMIDRRTIVTAALSTVAGIASIRMARAQAGMSRITAYGFSFAGLAPQYAGLQELWSQFRDRGLMIVGVPSNDFGEQEPGGATAIAENAQHQYSVTFPISAKAIVKGPNAHPFYK